MLRPPQSLVTAGKATQLGFSIVDNTIDTSLYPDPVVHTFLHFLYSNSYDPERFDPPNVWHDEGACKDMSKSRLIILTMAHITGARDLLGPVIDNLHKWVRLMGPVVFLKSLQEAYPREITADQALNEKWSLANDLPMVKEDERMGHNWESTESFRDRIRREWGILRDDQPQAWQLNGEFHIVCESLTEEYINAMVRYTKFLSPLVPSLARRLDRRQHARHVYGRSGSVVNEELLHETRVLEEFSLHFLRA